MKACSPVFIILFFSLSCLGQEKDGLVTITSAYSVKETTDKFIEIAKAKNLTIFARIDHSANAAKQGLSLRPTELVIFGNPKAGTPLMQGNQTAGIDLPLKILVWEDEHGKVWLTYNDPAWIATRHSLSNNTTKVIESMKVAMKGMTAGASSK